MPFCEECAKYWAPSAMEANGACPTCGRMLEEPKVQAVARGGKPPTVRELAGKDAKAPWHFKVLVVALVGYMAWRVIDLIGLA